MEVIYSKISCFKIYKQCYAIISVHLLNILLDLEEARKASTFIKILTKNITFNESTSKVFRNGLI